MKRKEVVVAQLDPKSHYSGGTQEYKEKAFAYDMACYKQGRILQTFGDHVCALVLAINIIFHIPLHELCTEKYTRHCTS
jgi:hypothetical protein